MTIQLRVLLILVSLLTAIYLIRKITKSQMKIEDSIYWIFTITCVLFLSIVPKVAVIISNCLGIDSTVNFVFLVIIFLLLMKIFFQSVKISQLDYKIGNLTQELAIKNARENGR